MSPEERQEVSDRMKKYWESRRHGPDGSVEDSPLEPE
jgi:hypothetical protein